MHTTESPGDTSTLADELQHHLARARALREAAAGDAMASRARTHLREWQARRLAATHADLLDSTRYGRAASFFLTELYGPKECSARDAEIARILPMLRKALPTSALQALVMALELDALSESLDAAMVAALRATGRADRIDGGAYAAAYRAVGQPAARERQIVLIRAIGEALESLAGKPLLASTLHLMRGPAHLAGLGELHDFLDHGLAAFRHMGAADEFLARIEMRERSLLARLFAGAPDPFAAAAARAAPPFRKTSNQ